MKRPNLWNWTDSELVAQLDIYGITLPGGFDRKAAIEAIKRHEESGAVQGLQETASYIEQLKQEEPTLELRKVIFHSAGEHDVPYVFVGVNGRCFYLPKEVEIEVPVYILNSAIRDAVEERLFPKVTPQGEVQWVTRKVQRFPYSIVE